MDPTRFRLAQAAPVPPEGLHDIIEPGPEPSLWPILAFLAFLLVLLAALVWLVVFLLKRRGSGAFTPPAATRALRELDHIDREREDLTPNRFVLAVSEVLKNYFAERYQDPVRYETTEEFLSRLAREDSRLPSAVQQELRDFLTVSEELKFGKRADAASLAAPLSRNARQILSLSESVNAPARVNSPTRAFPPLAPG